jgi:hypothetical protein
MQALRNSRHHNIMRFRYNLYYFTLNNILTFLLFYNPCYNICIHIYILHDA